MVPAHVVLPHLGSTTPVVQSSQQQYNRDRQEHQNGWCNIVLAATIADIAVVATIATIASIATIATVAVVATMVVHVITIQRRHRKHLAHSVQFHPLVRCLFVVGIRTGVPGRHEKEIRQAVQIDDALRDARLVVVQS